MWWTWKLWSCLPLNPSWAQNKFVPVECTQVLFSYCFGRVVCFACWRALVPIDFQQTSRQSPHALTVWFCLYCYFLTYEFAQPSLALDTHTQTLTHQCGEIKSTQRPRNPQCRPHGIKAFAFLFKNVQDINRHSVVNLVVHFSAPKVCQTLWYFFRGKRVIKVW